MLAKLLTDAFYKKERALACSDISDTSFICSKLTIQVNIISLKAIVR